MLLNYNRHRTLRIYNNNQILCISIFCLILKFKLIAVIKGRGYC